MTLSPWAKDRAVSALEAHLLELDTCLNPGAVITVENNCSKHQKDSTGNMEYFSEKACPRNPTAWGEDELRVLIDGACVIELFDQPHTPFLAAQWRQFARTTNITEKYTGKKLLKALTKLRATDDDHLRTAVVTLDTHLQSLAADIASAESAINADIYKLYGLTKEEIQLVESG